MGLVSRNWRWLACLACFAGCTLNPQGDLPTGRPTDEAGGVNGGAGTGSNVGASGTSFAGGSTDLPGNESAGASSGPAGAGGEGGSLQTDVPGEGGRDDVAASLGGAAGADPVIGLP